MISWNPNIIHYVKLFKMLLTNQHTNKNFNNCWLEGVNLEPHLFYGGMCKIILYIADFDEYWKPNY